MGRPPAGTVYCAVTERAQPLVIYGAVREEKIDPPGTFLSFLHLWREKLDLSISCSIMNQAATRLEKMRRERAMQVMSYKCLKSL